jgi:hypothetical protein
MYGEHVELPLTHTHLHTHAAKDCTGEHGWPVIYQEKTDDDATVLQPCYALSI